MGRSAFRKTSDVRYINSIAMIDKIMYKRVTIFLSITVIFLLISNYSALRKLDSIGQKRESTPTIIVEEDSSSIDLQILKEPLGTIVLIIDDFGYRNDLISDGFLKLNIPITCAIIPGHSQSKIFAEKAINAGKEVIIHMPMESSVVTSGEEEYKIKIGMTSEEVEWRINEVLKEIPSAVGMNNHQGSKATTDGKIMSVVASVLKERDKYFLDSRTAANTVGEKSMRSIGVPTASRHVFLDNNPSIDQISAQLDELVAFAKKRGIGIGIGHARPNTLKVLETKIPELLKAGYKFEFGSYAVN
ncbi:divergent polysaccharide deacetylase family protein [Candidatus Marinimicrobia bacterium]|nr:divergent polysaccharide deacetylase family protein [Candidatus Neomarinimicrobiota bacterium]